MWKKLAGLLTGMLITAPLIAQEITTSPLEEDLEQMLIEAGEEENPVWEADLEEWGNRMQQPFNLNSVTAEQLEELPVLSSGQVRQLMDYRAAHGAFQTIYELQLIEGFDKETIRRLLPFVCVNAVEQSRGFPAWKNLVKFGKQELITRLDIPFYTRKGYTNGKYLGDPYYHSLRYQFHYSHYLSVGITAEKDAGEPFFAGKNRKGYDYYSPYLLIKDWGMLKTLALGNYRLNFGQGLVLGNGFRLGKGFSLATVDYSAPAIAKQSSTDEYNYFTGAAATVEPLRNLKFSAFYSFRKLDGTLNEGVISSISETGLHRTESELERRQSFHLQAMGGNVSFRQSHWRVGVTGLYYFLNYPYEPRLTGYAKYNQRGNHFHNMGVDYKFFFGRFSWTGEGALGTKGYALLNRLNYRLAKGYQLMFIHRSYSFDYWNMFARSFGEGRVQNEDGCYLAVESTAWAKWKLFAAVDFFAFPQWKYRISKPSKGMDALFQATFTPSSKLSVYLNYRYKQKERDVTGTTGEKKLTSPTAHHRMRTRLTYTPTNGLMLQTTLNFNQFQQTAVGGRAFQPRVGWAVTQQGSYQLPGLPLQFNLQATYFHTDDYDSRIYASEKGLLYTFYTPSFYGHGVRCTAHLRFDWGKHLLLIAKFGDTFYQNRTEISSGNDAISGSSKADMQLQLRVKF